MVIYIHCVHLRDYYKAMKKVLLIDNYDSFTYNLVHYLESLDCEVHVYRNDEISIEEADAYHKIVLSPGPGLPSQAGIMNEIISNYHKTKSILGICLGQQAIGEVFGGTLVNLERVFHGISDNIQITVDDEPLYKGLPKSIAVGRYHSWCIASAGFPDVLEVTSTDGRGNIMSLRHKIYDVRGVQFHPESILTPCGMQIIANWLS